MLLHKLHLVEFLVIILSQIFQWGVTMVLDLTKNFEVCDWCVDDIGVYLSTLALDKHAIMIVTYVECWNVLITLTSI